MSIGYCDHCGKYIINPEEKIGWIKMYGINEIIISKGVDKVGKVRKADRLISTDLAFCGFVCLVGYMKKLAKGG